MSPRVRSGQSGGVRLRRILPILCGAAVFFGVASVVKPPPRSASAGNTPRRTLAPAPLANTAHPQGWKLLGMLDGAERTVLCFATPDGPRYSVFTREGVLLQADMYADDVYRVFPDLDIENMHLEPGPDGPLMLMDQDN